MEVVQIREIIERRFRGVIIARGGDAPEVLGDEFTLLGSGLDSLGFATLVVQLEDEFGCDPFSGAETLVYPRTFGELVLLYERFVNR